MQEEMQMSPGKGRFITIAIVIIVVIAGLAIANSILNKSDQKSEESNVMQDNSMEDNQALDSGYSNKDTSELMMEYNNTLEAGVYNINLEQSALNWEARKIVGDTVHEGSVDFKSGLINIDSNGQITNAEFVVDLNSIANFDLTSETFNDQLVNHLKSEDFFDVANYPEANLKVTDITQVEENNNEYSITADLTIKGKTNSVSFPATILQKGDEVNIIASLNIDRTLWDVRFGSLKFGPDAIVEDIFSINVDVIATKN